MEKKVGDFRIIAARLSADGAIKVLVDREDYKGCFRHQERYHLSMVDKNSKTEEEAIQKVEDFLSGYDNIFLWD